MQLSRQSAWGCAAPRSRPPTPAPRRAARRSRKPRAFPALQGRAARRTQRARRRQPLRECLLSRAAPPARRAISPLQCEPPAAEASLPSQRSEALGTPRRSRTLPGAATPTLRAARGRTRPRSSAGGAAHGGSRALRRQRRPRPPHTDASASATGSQNEPRAARRSPCRPCTLQRPRSPPRASSRLPARAPAPRPPRTRVRPFPRRRTGPLPAPPYCPHKKTKAEQRNGGTRDEARRKVALRHVVFACGHFDPA